MTLKTVVIFLSLLTAPLAASTSYAAPRSEQQSLQSVTLAVQNMTCALCPFTVKKALQGVDGVKTVTVDGDTKTAVVTFEAKKTTIYALIAATTNAGYPATVPH